MKNYFLRVENVGKTFGRGSSAVAAVNNVSFSVDRGSIVLIMGPSGSGKTTLVTMIGSLLTPDEGKIFYGDTEITSLPKDRLPELRSRKVGFVFQSFNLLSSLNVWENVAIVLELNGLDSKEAKNKAQNVLSALGLGGRLDYHIADLSGGEKQRVSIARALITNPDIVLADEPTANLDSHAGHKVMEILTGIAKHDGKVVVVVSHDMRLMDIADRVLWLEDGKIKEGQEELVTDPICEMTLEKRLSPYNFTDTNKGRIYYFCSRKCLSTFEQTHSKNSR